MDASHRDTIYYQLLEQPLRMEKGLTREEIDEVVMKTLLSRAKHTQCAEWVVGTTKPHLPYREPLY